MEASAEKSTSIISKKKLKILLINQLPWTPSLGAVKVHINLKEEYERNGHYVKKISIEDLYPFKNKYINNILSPQITSLIFSYLKKNASQFDVIDVNIGYLPFPKKEYNYNGLVLVRSHGLDPLYTQMEWSPLYKKLTKIERKKQGLKTKIGDFLRFLSKKVGEYEYQESLVNSDIIHVLNNDEKQYLLEYGMHERKIKVVPNGLKDSFINKANTQERAYKNAEVSFIGAWHTRKGISHFSEIIEQITQKHGSITFNLIGTGYIKNRIIDELNISEPQNIINIPFFKENELFALLQHTKVGFFPSYIEGFPLAVIELISFGIPVVVFDTSGTKDIIREIDKSLIIPLGNVNLFIKKISEILNMQEFQYRELSKKCIKVSQKYRNSLIAEQFIDIYSQYYNNNQ